jgi:mRNA interferase RelE/StbE
MPANIAALVRANIEQYAAAPASLANNVIQMKGYEGYFRMHIGDWAHHLHGRRCMISIIRISPRGGASEAASRRGNNIDYIDS